MPVCEIVVFTEPAAVPTTCDTRAMVAIDSMDGALHLVLMRDAPDGARTFGASFQTDAVARAPLMRLRGG